MNNTFKQKGGFLLQNGQDLVKEEFNLKNFAEWSYTLVGFNPVSFLIKLELPVWAPFI